VRLIAWSIRGRSGAPAARNSWRASARPPLRLVSRTEIGVKAEHGPRWLALAGFHRDTLNWREARLAAIGAEVSRVRECAGAPICRPLGL